MTEELPNFRAVTLDEAVEHADAGSTSGPLLRDWVTEENARRAEAQIEYEAQPVEVAGTTLTPGECVNLTIRDSWNKNKTRRMLNCVFVGQGVQHETYSRVNRRHILRFTRYGAKVDGWPKGETLYSNLIAGVDKVPTPAWIVKKEGERK